MIYITNIYQNPLKGPCTYTMKSLQEFWKKCLNYKQTASWMQVLQVSRNIPNWMLCMQWNIYMNLYKLKNSMGRMHDFWNFWYLGWVYVNTFYPIHKFHFMSCKPTINSLQWLWLWFVKAYASKNVSNIQNLCIIPFN